MQQLKPQNGRRQNRPQLQRRSARHNNQSARNSLSFVNQVSPKQYTAEQVLMLQRTIGNRATISMLQGAGVIQRKNNDDSPLTTIRNRRSSVMGGNDEIPEVQGLTDQSNQEDLLDDNKTVDSGDPEVKDQEVELKQTEHEASSLSNELRGSVDGSNMEHSISETESDPYDNFDDADLMPTTMNISKKGNFVNRPNITTTVYHDIDGSSVLVDEEMKIRQRRKKDLEWALNKRNVVGVGGATGGSTTTSAWKEGTVSTLQSGNVLYQAVQAGKRIKEGLDIGAQANHMSTIGGQVAEGGMTAFQTILNTLGNFLLPIGTLLYRIHGVIVKGRQMRAFRQMAQDSGAQKEDFKRAKKRNRSLEDQDAFTSKMIGAYAYNKTRRGYWIRIARAAISVGQVISRLITLLSAGTAAIVTEATNLALGLMDGAALLVRSLKGFYKVLRMTRGRRRKQMGMALYEQAKRGHKYALQALLDSGFPSKKWMGKRKTIRNLFDTKNGDRKTYNRLVRLATRPQTIDDMQDYIVALEEADMGRSAGVEIAESMRST